MLDFNPSEFLVVAFVALVVIGPKDLPKAMRVLGYWVGKARGVARQFRSGFDTMVREAELAEMEKKWAEENARIMREHPADDSAPPHVEPAFHPVDAPSPPPPELTPAPVMLDKPAVSVEHPQVRESTDDTGPAADNKAAS